jgi:hypothetical protein
MSTKDPTAPAKPGFKQKAVHEFKDFLRISLYLAFFFCALVAYTNLLLRQYDINSSLDYAFAIINALVIGKVILIGEMIDIGKIAETRPVYQSVLIKAFVFSLLVLAFHFLEEFVKRLIHHEPAGTVLHEMHANQLIARSIMVFSTFIPLFAFMELRRVLGEEEFYALFRKCPATDKPGLSARN